jgi:putative MATE family efflux protein
MKDFLSKASLFLGHLKAAINGDYKELTSGSINKALFMLSVPMILEMVMESLFAVVDVYFVSKIGVNAVATIGLTESMLMLIYSTAIGLSMATTAVVARRVGEKDFKGAADSSMQAVYLTIVFSVLLSIPGVLFSKELLRLMGGSEELIEEGYMYTQLMLGGNFIIMFLFLINAIFRGAGDASLAMRSLWIANIMNILLCPIFIFGWGIIPEMGIQGAAVATTIGRGTGVVYQCLMLLRKNSVIKIQVENLKIQLSIITSLIKISLGGMGQFLIESASWIFLVRIVSTFGSDALAGYTIAFRIIIFTLLPSFGLANAAATLVGQNLGANEPERAEKSVWKAAFYNMIFLGSISFFFILFAEFLIGIFSSEPIVISYAKSALQIICIGYIFFAYGMVIAQSFNGAGDTRTPTYINLFTHWVVQIPLAYFLSIVLELGPQGTFIAIAFAFSLHALISVFIFKKGKWKKVKV